MDSPERGSEKQHADPHREGARPKAEGPIYSRVGGSNDSEGDDKAPRGVQHKPQLHQLPHVESRALQKDNLDKSGLPKVEIPTIRVEGEKTPLSQVTAFSILSQIKVCHWQHFFDFTPSSDIDIALKKLSTTFYNNNLAWILLQYYFRDKLNVLEVVH